MPLFEYDCASCNRQTEILERNRTDRLSSCPHCGSKKIARKFSAFRTSTAHPASPTSSCPTGTCPFA